MTTERFSRILPLFQTVPRAQSVLPTCRSMLCNTRLGPNGPTCFSVDQELQVLMPDDRIGPGMFILVEDSLASEQVTLRFAATMSSDCSQRT